MCKWNPQYSFTKFKNLIFLRIGHYSEIGHSVRILYNIEKYFDKKTLPLFLLTESSKSNDYF